MIDVLIVEDSPAARELLVYILGNDADVRVVGTATTGEEAVAMAERLKPHVVTMDIHMPSMDGFEATRRIMQRCPVPVVVVSGSSSREETAWAFRAIDAGALAVVHKPVGPEHPEYQKMRDHLLHTVKLMAEVKVVRRWARTRLLDASVTVAAEPLPQQPVDLIAIGASTGGPPALQTILAGLPPHFDVPIVIVQHMAPGFIGGFAEWLAGSCPVPVQVAKEGTLLMAGQVYLAPDGKHMTVSNSRKLCLVDEGSRNGLRPSVGVLFHSVAEVFGARAAGVLLTGMGKDGAEELRLMRQRGAVTIAQDRETSVVYGMPGEAARIGAAAYELPPIKIAALLSTLGSRVGRRPSTEESR